MNDDWVETTLGDLVTVARGISYNSEQTAGAEDSVPFLNLKSVQRGGGYRMDGLKWYSGPIKPAQRLAEGELLIANTDLTRERAILGAPILVPYGLEGATFSHHLSKLLPKQADVNLEFLNLALQSSVIREHLISCGRGTTVMGVSSPDIGRTPISLPPLPVQRRIVDLMAHLDNQITNLRLERDAGRGLRKATLSNLLDATREIPADYDAAFDLADSAQQESPTSEPAMNEWASAKLEEVCAIRSSRRVLQSQWTSEGVPFWRGREVTSLALTGSVSPDLFISKRHYEELKNRSGVPLQGDLLLTAIGTIGNAWVVPDDSPRYFKDASVLWLSPDPSMDGKFLKYWFESREFLSQVVRGNGTTVDTLTIAGLSGMQITCPPLPVQHRIVDLMAHLDNQIAGMDMEVSTLESLRRQLLASLLSQGVELPASYDLLLEGVA